LFLFFFFFLEFLLPSTIQASICFRFLLALHAHVLAPNTRIFHLSRACFIAVPFLSAFTCFCHRHLLWLASICFCYRHLLSLVFSYLYVFLYFHHRCPTPTCLLSLVSTIIAYSHILAIVYFCYHHLLPPASSHLLLRSLPVLVYMPSSSSTIVVCF
jgi:hypothetical protein